MGMTAPDLAWVRAEVGGQPDDTTLNASYDRLEGKAAVALEIWRTRYADFLRTPAALAADGLSQSTSANITAMTKTIARLELLAAEEAAGDDIDTGMPESGFLSRADRSLRRGRRSEEETYAALGDGYR